MFEEKTRYYLDAYKSTPANNESKKLKIIAKNYHLNEIYYGYDDKNLFKMVDRYKYKIILIPIFLASLSFNLFEIIFSLLSVTVWKSKSEDYSYTNRLLGAVICLLNILITLILSSITVQKLKIKTSVFY